MEPGCFIFSFILPSVWSELNFFQLIFQPWHVAPVYFLSDLVFVERLVVMEGRLQHGAGGGVTGV